MLHQRGRRGLELQEKSLCWRNRIPVSDYSSLKQGQTVSG